MRGNISDLHGINWWRVLGLFLILGIIAAVVALIIISQVKEYHAQQDPKLHELRHKLRDVHPAIHNIKLYKANKSFTTNKKKVHLCLYDENGKYYDDNMLGHVLLHELAHVITKSIGHTEEFHNNFQMLLDKAHNMGVHDKNKEVIQDYCQH